jgi:hypothetical protein
MMARNGTAHRKMPMAKPCDIRLYAPYPYHGKEKMKMALISFRLLITALGDFGQGPR